MEPETNREQENKVHSMENKDPHSEKNAQNKALHNFDLTSTQKQILQFTIGFTQFIDKEGHLSQNLPQFANPELLQKLYRWMVLTRLFDTKAIALQRTGKLGTYPSTLGQEAIGVGIGAAMRKEDVLCPYYREYGGQFMRGVLMSEILLYWGGDERGSDFKEKSISQDFPICVPIGSQTLHATGVAVAMKLKKENRATVAVVGDGGTSRGDFYESMNLAGVWNLPIVFVINNNQWAISVCSKNQTAAESFAQKGIAAGIQCEQIDGNDVIAVQYTMEEALQRARTGKGPTVIEAVTYRLSDHTTADDARRYRKAEELENFRKEDPIFRLKTYMIKNNLWDENREKLLHEELAPTVQSAVDEYLNTPPQPVSDMFDYLYATLPVSYQNQRAAALQQKEVKSHG